MLFVSGFIYQICNLCKRLSGLSIPEVTFQTRRGFRVWLTVYVVRSLGLENSEHVLLVDDGRVRHALELIQVVACLERRHMDMASNGIISGVLPSKDIPECPPELFDFPNPILIWDSVYFRNSFHGY